jgi:trimeric autotransporter adhesin
MLGSGVARRLASKIFRSVPGVIAGALLAMGAAPADAQSVPPPSSSAPCDQNARAGAFACGELSSAVGALSTAVGVQAIAGGTPSSVFANARTTAFGEGSQAGATGAAQGNATAIGQNAQANAGGASAFGQGAQANFQGGTAVGRVARANALNASAFGISAQAGAFSTALGSNSDATGQSAVAIGSSAQAADLSTAIGGNAQAPAPNAVALGQGSLALQGNTVSVGNETTGLFRRIVDLAPAVTGTDAVNLNQLLSLITGNNSFALPPPSATGAGSTAIAAGAVASAASAVALGQASRAAGNSSTALGRSASATGDFSTAVGQGAAAIGVQSVAIGQGAQALAPNAVAIGSGTVADQPNTASFGGRRLANLAPGISPSDAATVGQMNRTGSRLSGGIAAAAALGGAVVPDPGRTFIGASGATYNGEGGLAFGLVHHLDGSGLVLSGGVALGTSGSAPIGRVAVGWLF